MEHLQSLGHTTWLSNIKNCLGETYFEHSNSENLKRLITISKDNRYKLFIENILSNITINPKLRTYCLFKTDYIKEAYLFHVHNRQFFTAISRFRTSSHSLKIETGRHTIPYTPIENRLCSFCNLNSIDDEMHMLLNCTFHKIERANLFKSKQHFFLQSVSELCDKDLFCAIMNMKNPVPLFALGKYLHTGFNRRNNLSQNTLIQNLPL